MQTEATVKAALHSNFFKKKVFKLYKYFFFLNYFIIIYYYYY